MADTSVIPMKRKESHTSSLFFRNSGYLVGSIQFDILLSEAHSLEAQVTEHPIEDGSVVSDHIRDLPRKGSLSGLVSNYPLQKDFYTLPSDFREKIAAMGSPNFIESFTSQYGFQKAPGPTQADYEALQRPKNRAQDTWTLFKDLMAAKTPVAIVTGLEKYYDAVVTKVTADRDPKSGESQTFRVDFQEIKIVQLTEVALTTDTKPLKLGQASPKVSKGKVGAIEKPFKIYAGGSQGHAKYFSSELTQGEY